MTSQGRMNIQIAVAIFLGRQQYRSGLLHIVWKKLIKAIFGWNIFILNFVIHCCNILLLNTINPCYKHAYIVLIMMYASVKQSHPG